MSACAQVQQITQIATPLLNTFSQGILGNPVARQALQDLTVTPNLERLIQGLQNLTQITNPPIISLLVGLLISAEISAWRTSDNSGSGDGSALPYNSCSLHLLCSNDADLEEIMSHPPIGCAIRPFPGRCLWCTDALCLSAEWGVVLGQHQQHSAAAGASNHKGF